MFFFFLLCLAWSNFFVASTSWRRICRQNSPARQPSAVQQPAQPRPGRDPLKDIRKPYKYKLIKIMPACPLPVCVCVCPPRRQQRLLSCICCWPTLFIYILFHFILFHFMLAFFCCLPLLLLLSRAGVMNCFTYTLNMQHMFLAVDALNIYMQSQCPFCGTFIVTLSVCVSRYVCVSVCVPQITFGLLQMVSRLLNATKSRMRWQLAASQRRTTTAKSLRLLLGPKTDRATCWFQKTL